MILADSLQTLKVMGLFSASTLTLIRFWVDPCLAKLVSLVGQLNCGRSIPFSWDFLPS